MKKSYNKSEIKNILKIKDPFLMVDKVNIISLNKIAEGEKKLKNKDWFFKSHFFNNEPVMPGTLLTEAMLQTTIINLHKNNKNTKKYLVVKTESNFYSKVTKACKLKINSIVLNMKNGIIECESNIILNNKKVSYGKFKFIDSIEFNINKNEKS